MQRRQRWVIGNWKMNGSLAANQALLEGILRQAAPQTVNTAVCAPFIYLPQIRGLLQSSKLLLGAQDVSEYEKGAYTGQTSAGMLKEFSVALALVGHSERRTLNGEDAQTVAHKAEAAVAAGLMPVICIGENLEQREAGQAERIVAEQLEPCRALLARASANVLIAYEPVWAIGTGKTATPEQAQAMHGFIRQWLRAINDRAIETPVLYGGSVKASNAASLFAQPDIDGALVGGAALVADEFNAIVTACN